MQLCLLLSYPCYVPDIKFLQAVAEMVSSNTFTFRLRRCPATAGEATLCDSLSKAFGDIKPRDIRVQSLATALDPWETPSTKTATLNFAKLPSVVETQIEKGEWWIECPGLDGRLILDTHFLGITPLNDIEAQTHNFEYIP